MRRESWAISTAILACCLGACSGSRPSERHAVGGVLVYWNSDLRKLPRPPGTSATLLGASVTGLQTVEVLKVSSDTATATAMPATPVSLQGCGRTPVALGAIPDPSGSTDIAVEDPCGNYVVQKATGSESVAAAWDPAWTPQTVRYVETSQEATGEAVLVLAGTSASLFRRDLGGRWHALGELPVPSPAGVFLTRAVLPVVGTVWAIQGGGEIDLVDVASAPGPLASVVMKQASVEPPNLVPYQGYDHLTGIPDELCPHTLIGVATFVGKDAPRALVSIDMEHPGGGLYSTHEFGSSGFDAINVAAVALGDGSVVLGSVGTINGATMFKAFRMEGCGVPQQVAETPAQFEFKTAPLPAFGANTHQPRTNGAKLVGWDDAASSTVTFAHYDGYDLRLFYVQEQGNTWQAWQKTRTIHEARTDLSAPAH